MLKKELLEQSRSKKLLIISVIFLFAAVSSVIFAKIMPELLKNLDTSGQGITIKLPTPSYKDAIDQFSKNISQLIVFILIFVVAGAISEEKSKKTLELLLVKPLPRKTFVLAKYFSYFISISLVYALSSAIFYFYTVSLFGVFSLAHFGALAFAALIYLLLIVSVTIFGSSISANTTIATATGFVGMIFFGIIYSLFKNISSYTPYYLVDSYKDIMKVGFTNQTWESLIISLVLITICIFLSVKIVKRQEVER